MKTLGLIGGTSWLSTIDYYRTINQQVSDRLGGLNSARLFMYSVNFEELQPPVDPNEWGRLGTFFGNVAHKLETAGADCILLCANTPHMVADIVQQHTTVPLIHIADATAKAIALQKISKVGLLGTRITMEQPFFRDKLAAAGISTLIPGDEDRHFMHASILNEMGRNIFTAATKTRWLAIIDDLTGKGAEGIIFGCTEVPLLIQASEVSVPVFDTLLLHATAAVDFALT
jgi:aspartate racemase